MSEQVATAVLFSLTSLSMFSHADYLSPPCQTPGVHILFQSPNSLILGPLQYEGAILGGEITDDNFLYTFCLDLLIFYRF